MIDILIFLMDFCFIELLLIVKKLLKRSLMEIVTLAIILRMSCEPAGEPLHEHCSTWTAVRPRGGASYTRGWGQEIAPASVQFQGVALSVGCRLLGKNPLLSRVRGSVGDERGDNTLFEIRPSSTKTCTATSTHYHCTDHYLLIKSIENQAKMIKKVGVLRHIRQLLLLHGSNG